MGNLSFIVPTENVSDINNIEKVAEVIRNGYPFYTVEVDKDFNSVSVHYLKNSVMNLYFEQECYILNFDRDIKYLEETGEKDLAKKLIELKEIDPDLNKCISSTYSSSPHLDKGMKHNVDHLLREYFKGYLFDEGIHPEYMSPDYIRRPIKKEKFKFSYIFLIIMVAFIEMYEWFYNKLRR